MSESLPQKSGISAGFDSPPDSPQAIGDIVGRAFKACRQNIAVIVRILLVPTIFATISGIALQWVITYGTAAVAEGKDIAGGIVMALVGFVAVIVSTVATWICTIRLLALVRMVTGFSPDYAHAMKVMNERKWSIIGIYFISGSMAFAVIMVVTIALVVMSLVASMFTGGSNASTGAVAALGILTAFPLLIVLFSIYMLAFFLSLSILACEDVPLMTVIGKSLQLSFKHFWRAMAFGGLLMLVYTVISYPLSLPVVAITLFDMFRNGLMTQDGISESYKAPLYVMVINQVWESLMGIILRPAMFFAFGLFYYDLRLRSEGLDISRRLDNFRQAFLTR